LGEKVKTLNIIPMIEGNLLLAKANDHYERSGTTSHYKWLLSAACDKFKGTLSPSTSFHLPPPFTSFAFH